MAAIRVIVNPAACRGGRRRRLNLVQAALAEQIRPERPILTEGPGHATLLAHDAVVEGVRRLVVVGGDGTISEAAQSLAGTDVELGIVPLGTGNDLARSLGLPFTDPRLSVAAALGGRTRPIDVGRDGERCFVSTLGLGFAADVAFHSNRIRWPRGSPAFALAVCRALGGLRPFAVHLDLDGEPVSLRAVAVMIHNTPFAGGGLHLAPGARVDDGYLDAVVIGPISRFDLVRNLAKVYRGAHLSHPQFWMRRARHVRVETDAPVPKMFDGDVAGLGPIDAGVSPASLTVVAP
jgi:diacylglycerol kinase (ATP)